MEKEAQFLVNCGLYKQEQLEVIKGFLESHKQHNTLIVFRDWHGIYAVCRWNMDTPDIAHIIDVGVREDKRFSKVLQDLIIHGRQLFGKVKYIRFRRGFKKRDKVRLISIKKFLKEK